MSISRPNRLPIMALCLVLGLLLVVQLRTRHDIREMARTDDWDYVVADLVDSNARLRQEIEVLETQLGELRAAGGSAAILQSLVDEANQLRIANGQVAVSGPGVEVMVAGPVSVLDLQDLINELRNAGAEALAVNEERIIAWSAISTDGEGVTVDGRPVEAPYSLKAIGDGETLQAALLRPGGLVALLRAADNRIAIQVEAREKLTLGVCRQPVQFVYARAAD